MKKKLRPTLLYIFFSLATLVIFYSFAKRPPNEENLKKKCSGILNNPYLGKFINEIFSNSKENRGK